jgi:hypothetical protein
MSAGPFGPGDRAVFLHGIDPGFNTDLVDPDACAAEAARLGHDRPEDLMVAHYAGQRWMRGEETAALNMLHRHGFGVTACYRVIAAGLGPQQVLSALMSEWQPTATP